MMVSPLDFCTDIEVVEHGISEAAFIDRITNAIDGTIGKLRDAIEAMVWRIAIHPSQELGRMHYTELSVGYIAKAANVGWETARQAWHRLHGAAGWISASVHQVRDMGATLRKLPPKGLWGQHLLLHPDAAAAALHVTVSRNLGPIHTGLPDALGWEPLTPVLRGRHLMACCPWHNDNTPSMILNTNSDGCSGSGVCLSCTGVDGGPLRIYWRSHDGLYAARHARSRSGLQTVDAGTGTIQSNRVPIGRSVYLLGSLGCGGMTRSGSKIDDLLVLLAYAEKRGLSDRATDDAYSDHANGMGVPDSYVSTDPMVPVGWRVINTRRGEVSIPDKWEPVSTRWVLADLDGFDDAPIGDASLARASISLEQWAQRHPGLSGRIGVVRTSHLGVQVIAELDSERDNPRAWYRSREAASITTSLDTMAMAMARDAGFVGGHADQCVHAAGRMMRRPGWRQDKGGQLCRSRLAYATI